MHGEEDRLFGPRAIDVLMPCPIGHAEGIMLVPDQLFIPDDRLPLAADDEVDCAGCMPMALGLLSRPEHLDPTTQRGERGPSGHGVDVLQGETIIWTSL